MVRVQDSRRDVHAPQGFTSRAGDLPEAGGLQVEEPDAHLPAHPRIAGNRETVHGAGLDVVADSDVRAQVLEERQDLPREEGMRDDGPFRRRSGGKVVDLDEDLAPGPDDRPETRR